MEGQWTMFVPVKPQNKPAKSKKRDCDEMFLLSSDEDEDVSGQNKPEPGL